MRLPTMQFSCCGVRNCTRLAAGGGSSEEKSEKVQKQRAFVGALADRVQLSGVWIVLSGGLPGIV